MFKTKKFKVAMVILCSLIIAVLLASCAAKPAPAATSAPTLFDRVTALETASRNNDSTDGKLDARITALETEIKSMPTSETITQALNQVTTLENDVNTLKNSSSDQNDINNLKSEVSTLQTSVTNAGTSEQADVTALKQQIAQLTAQITTLTSNVTALQSTPTPTSTSSSSGGATGTGVATNGQVTAQIISYSYNTIFNGNTSAPTVLTFTPTQDGLLSANATPPTNTATLVAVNGSTKQWVEATSSQQFQLQIQNQTGKTISNIQLQLAFVFIKNDGTQVTLPSGVTYAMSSMGNPQWSNAGNDPTYTAWATGSTNSILSGIWQFTQNPGTSSYYSTLTITLPIVTDPNGALNLNSLTFYAVPILKIVGFQTN
jgi:TolA-binding protein